MSSKKGSNYLRLSLSAGTNEIVTYHPILFDHVKQFRDDVVNGREGRGVPLFIATEGGDSFDEGNTIKFVKEGTDRKSFIGWRAYNKNKEFVVAYKKVEEKKRVDWTTEDVCEYVIKPKCARQVKPSYYTDIVKDDNFKGKSVVLKKDFDRGTFVSYARQTKFSDLINALNDYFTSTPGIDSSNVYVWMDIFCANQPALTSTQVDAKVTKIQYDLLTDGLHHAISRFPCKVIVFDNWKDPSVLKRAWCVWEVFGVALAEKQLVAGGNDVKPSARLGIAMIESERDEYLVSFKDSEKFDDVLKSLSTIDVAEAECFDVNDKKTIMDAIETQSSYAEVNETVLSQLRSWHIRTAQDELSEMRKKMTQTEDQLDLPTMLNSLGLLLQIQGKLDEAEPVLREAMNIDEKILGKEHPRYAGDLNNLAQLLLEQGDLEGARLLLEESLAIKKKVYGPLHSKVALGLNNLGQLLSNQGKLVEAEPLMREAMRISEKVYGKEHYDYALKLNNLAQLLSAKGDYVEAEKLQREAMRIRKATLGEEHPLYASDLNNLGQLLSDQGKPDEARPLFEEAIKIWKKVYGPEHSQVAVGLNNLGGLLSDQGEYKQAEELVKQALKIDLKVYGREHPETVTDIAWVGSLLQSQGKYDEAEPVLREVVELRGKLQGKEHPDYASALNNLAGLLKTMGKLDEAVAPMKEALEIFKKVMGPEHPNVATLLNNLAGLLRQEGRNDEAKKLVMEAYRIALKTLGKDHPDTKNYEFYINF